MRALARPSPAYAQQAGNGRQENDEGDDGYRDEKRAEDGEQHHRGQDPDDQHEQNTAERSDPGDVDAMRLSGICRGARAPSRSTAIPVRRNDLRFGARSLWRRAIVGHEGTSSVRIGSAVPEICGTRPVDGNPATDARLVRMIQP